MGEIKVSIVMPVLNGQPYFKEAMESVLKQTLKEIEVLVIDGGSTDGTAEYVENIANTDGRVRLLKAEKKSMGHQYNIGIQNAKGKYVGFCESDDYVHGEMYEKMYTAAEQNRLDFVKSDFDMFIGSGTERISMRYSVLLTIGKELYDTIMNPRDFPEILQRELNMWNGIYNRKFLLENNIKLNETKGAAFQDMGFVLQSFMMADRIMYLKMPSYYYRQDNISASAYNYAGHLHFVKDETKYIRNFVKQNGVGAPFRAAVLKRCFTMFCMAYDSVQFHSKPDEETKKEADEFLGYLYAWYQELECYEIREENLDYPVAPSMLQLDPAEFKLIRKHVEQSERDLRKRFFDCIKEHPFVIFGAGERGTALYAVCCKNNINNILCFCDNSREKANRTIMGKQCFLPMDLRTELKENYEKAYYVVANETYYNEIKNQLVQMGVEQNRILRCIGISPHAALKLDIQEYIPD